MDGVERLLYCMFLQCLKNVVMTRDITFKNVHEKIKVNGNKIGLNIIVMIHKLLEMKPKQFYFQLRSNRF